MAHFGSIFPILEAKKIFQKNPALSCTTSHGILAPYQTLEKIMNDIRKDGGTEGQKDRWKEGRTEGQTDPLL